MFDLTIIDIGIGIAFVFLLLSVIASTINEIVLSSLNMRGKELLEGLKTLLDDADAKGLVDKLYNHGHVFGLFKGNFDPKKPGNLPSYIPSQNFVMAFLDIVPSAAQALEAGEQKTIAAAAGAKASGPPDASASTAVPTPQAPATVPPQSLTQTVPAAAAPLSSTPPAEPTAPATPTLSTGVARDETLFNSLQQAAQKLAQDSRTEKVGKPLVAMLNATGNDASKLKTSLEDWYNSAMDRVSGWYKYRTQKILFGIGLVLAVSINVDAIKIVKQLSKDSTLRQSIVAAAGAAKQPQTGSPGSANDEIKAVQQQVADVNGLGIPIGWTQVPDILVKKVRENGVASYGPWQWGYLNVLLGWLMTAVAVSLGAPFWFDILNKFMVVRSTVKPREKSQEEASKEPTRNT